jgi:uncharacterized membrane protein YkvA (DUF1232 family)
LLAAIYLLSPVDLIPEVLTPVFGFLDDIVFLWLSLRWLIRSGSATPPPPTARVVDGPGNRFRP